jgi:L-ascorbate metabolism protein UlaG (beta-lactamase superfamily)
MKKVFFLTVTVTILLLSGCTKESVSNLQSEPALKCGRVSETMNLNHGQCLGLKQMVSRIHWIEQACFRIEGPKIKIYTDPLAITQTDSADVILITHPHEDHFSIPDIDKVTSSKAIIIAPADCAYTGIYAKFISLKPGDEYIVNKCIKIKAVPAYNITKTQFHPKSNNWVGYLITINGVTIYHAGDTERIPEMKDMSCDIALLPLGQTYTMNSVADAAESAKDVKAKVAIPMHYGLYEGTEADAATFKSLLSGVINVVIKTKGQ